MHEKKVALYVRVSTRDQKTDLQIRELERFVELRGWTIKEIYEDKATGKNDKRTNLKRLISDAKARRVDVIVCWKLDRVFRSLKDMVLLLSEFNDLGIEFISLKEQIDMTTASGKLLTHLLAAFAEFELGLIRERVMSGLDAAKAKGKKLGRPKLKTPESEVIALRRAGGTVRSISATLGISKSAAQRLLALSQKPLQLA